MRNIAITYRKLNLLFLSIFLTLFSNLFAQTQPFIIPVNPISLTEKQNRIKEKVLKNSFYKEMQFVQMGKLPAIQTSGVLKFFIPGRQEQIMAQATRVMSFSSSTFEWYGKIDGGLGNIIVISKEGKITASIHLPNETYEIISTDNDLHLLLTYDKLKSETLNKCGTKELGNSPQRSESNKDFNALRIDACQDKTRVLVLFTPAARDAVADINQTIDLCVSQFNQAVYNSAVTSQAYSELADKQLFIFNETNDIQADLNRLINDVNAQTARNNTNADYVILLTNGASYGAFGIAGAVEPNDNRAYAISQVNTATNERKTFAHEAGHLYGCRHDNDNTGQPYAHGYIFRPSFLSPRCYTLMVNGGEITGDRSRLLNFSNPNVFIEGTATGTESTNNNARRVSETFNTLRNFRTPPFRPFTASIEGTQTGDECTQGNWEAVVSCGVAPYSFEWSYSYDGFTYYPDSYSEFYSTILNCPADLYSTLYVRLVATSGDGQTSTAFLSVPVNHNGDPKYEKFKESPILEVGKANNLKAYPNPVTAGITQLEIQLEETQPVKLEIVNILGQSVKVLFEGNLQEGRNIKVFNTAEIAKGVYLYKLSGKTFSLTKKLIIQ